MYLTPEQKAIAAPALDAAPYQGKSDAEASALMNVPSEVPNPSPQPSIPRPIAATELLALLSPQTIGNIAGMALLGHLDGLAWNQERARIKTWVNSFLVPMGKCPPEEAAAVGAYLDAADPDPSWSPNVAGPTPWQALFPGVAFPSPSGGGVTVVGICFPAYIAEARS